MEGCNKVTDHEKRVISLKANAKNVNAVAVGKGNTATNDVGVIGGK